jgi:hypothetical protein
MFVVACLIFARRRCSDPNLPVVGSKWSRRTMGTRNGFELKKVCYIDACGDTPQYSTRCQPCGRNLLLSTPPTSEPICTPVPSRFGRCCSGSSSTLAVSSRLLDSRRLKQCSSFCQHTTLPGVFLLTGRPSDHNDSRGSNDPPAPC